MYIQKSCQIFLFFEIELTIMQKRGIPKGQIYFTRLTSIADVSVSIQLLYWRNVGDRRLPTYSKSNQRRYDDRTKYNKQARVIIIDKAAEIIERYRSKSYMNYVFPIIKRCNPTQSKLYV